MANESLSPAQVVDAYFDAMAARDFDRLRTCLSNTRFTHRSPVAAISDPDTYAAYISRVGPVLDGLERRRTFVDGDEVCAILEYRIRLSELIVVPVVLWFRVVNGRIVSIETFFDASEYRQMIGID